MDYPTNRRIYIPHGKFPSIEAKKWFRGSKVSWQFYKRWINRKTRYAERDEINKQEYNHDGGTLKKTSTSENGS